MTESPSGAIAMDREQDTMQQLNALSRESLINSPELKRMAGREALFDNLLGMVKRLSLCLEMSAGYERNSKLIVEADIIIAEAMAVQEPK